MPIAAAGAARRASHGGCLQASFEDGEEFSAVAPQSSLLTVSVPLGLQIGDNPGLIELRSPLTIANGQNFSLVGGEINLSNS